MRIMRILIVDDEYKTRESLSRLILRLFPEFKIIGEAENGVDGARQIQTLHPDLVITDIKMPKMDGLAMIANVWQSSPDTRYLVLTGYADFEYAQKAVRLPVVDYLLKPVSVEQLKAILEKILEKIKKPATDDLPQEKEVSTSSEFVSFAVQDIKENFAKKLYLDEYAERFHITPEYASSLFARETGFTFSSYLKNLRIEKAKELLLHTNLKIYEVALRTGYSDPKYFCRVFKEITGQSPKSYARKEQL